MGTLVVTSARGEDTCISHLSYVHLASSDAGDRLVEALAPHLRAELHGRDIGVCLGEEGDSANARRDPVAEILLHDDGQTVTITIHDLVTDKRVERELDLASLPADTRLLAIATSVDELLRASWLETLLVSPRRAGADRARRPGKPAQTASAARAARATARAC